MGQRGGAEANAASAPCRQDFLNILPGSYDHPPSIVTNLYAQLYFFFCPGIRSAPESSAWRRTAVAVLAGIVRRILARRTPNQSLALAMPPGR